MEVCLVDESSDGDSDDGADDDVAEEVHALVDSSVAVDDGPGEE